MGENGNALGTFKRRCRYNSLTPYVELSLSPPNEKREDTVEGMFCRLIVNRTRVLQ